MLDFPNAPAVNDTFQGWTYDGAAWTKPKVSVPPSDNNTYVRKNGVWVPGVRTEFINCQAKNSVDITVPVGPRILRWTGSPSLAVTGAAQTYLVLRMSTDGTNFNAVAASYGNAGYYTIGGTGAFTRWAATSDTFGYLAPAPVAGDSAGATEGHTMHGMVNLDRTSSSETFTWRTTAWSFQTGTNMWIKYEIRGWCATFADNGLRLKALRFYTSTAQNYDNVQGNGFFAEWL